MLHSRIAVIALALGISCVEVSAAEEVIVEERPVGNAWARPKAPQAAPGEPWLAVRTQLESVQREVQVLQGVVEDLQHQLQQMRGHQQSLYQDLEARLNALTVGKEREREKEAPRPQTSAPKKEKEKVADVKAAPVKAPPTSLDEKGTYDYAYDLLQHREYLAALEQFKGLVAKYPEGEHVASAYYWMGEIYLLGGDVTAADSAFATVITRYPTHVKAADALLKRGNIQYAEEKFVQARAFFNDVKARFPDTAAARLAEARLIQMKQDGR